MTRTVQTVHRTVRQYNWHVHAIYTAHTVHTDVTCKSTSIIHTVLFTYTVHLECNTTSIIHTVLFTYTVHLECNTTSIIHTVLFTYTVHLECNTTSIIHKYNSHCTLRPVNLLKLHVFHLSVILIWFEWIYFVA